MVNVSLALTEKSDGLFFKDMGSHSLTSSCVKHGRAPIGFTTTLSRNGRAREERAIWLADKGQSLAPVLTALTY